MYECWKRLAEKMEEEVLDKYKVEDSKRGAEAEAPLWNGGKIRMWREDCWARIALFKNSNLQASTKEKG